MLIPPIHTFRQVRRFHGVTGRLRCKILYLFNFAADSSAEITYGAFQFRNGALACLMISNERLRLFEAGVASSSLCSYKWELPANCGHTF
jgi:hypothetical protein